MANSGWSRRYRVEMQKFATNTSGTSFTSFFAGLDTNTTVNDDASNVAASTTEPTSTGSYARQGSFVWATPTAPGSLDVSCPALNNASISWTSTGAFSTTSTTLKVVTIWNTSTLATTTEAAFCGRAQIAVPQAVNASGITLTIAASGLAMGFVSAP